MRTFTLCCKYVVSLILLLCIVTRSYAQRIYATGQEHNVSGVCLLCGVVNPERAADGNLQSFSTLTVTVGLLATSYQELIFPTTGGVPANTPVTLKLGSGNNLVDVTLLGGILLQPYNGTTPVGGAVAAATLLSALSNNSQFEVTLKPTQTFDRVRVTLDAGLLGAATSIYVYDAFYGSGPGPCNTAIDELHGVSSALLNLGVDVGGVANPQRAIDGDLTTASTLNASVAALGAYAEQTVIYSSPSVVGDSVRLTLGIPPALISAGVLANTSITSFNGNTSNNDTRFFNSALLSVRLLDIVGGVQKVVVTFVPTKVFDRIRLRVGGGIAAVLTTLNFYEAQHLIPSPAITVNNVSVSSLELCSGSKATLSATPVANTVFNWYTQPTGGTPVFTGAAFTTPALTATTTYYVDAMRDGCTDASQRTAIKITVDPLPLAPVITTNTESICQGQTATFTAQTVSGVTVNWYAGPTGGAILFTGNTFTSPVLTANTNYYAEAVVTGGCASATRTQVTVTTLPTQVVPVLSSTGLTINAGKTATISVTSPAAGITYNWFTAAAGGSPVFTGTSFTTPVLTATTTYYVEGASATCTSPSRAAVTITVNPLPDVAVTPSTQAVNSGQTATFTASSTTPNSVFHWYTTPTGGTSIFTGATFVTPAVTSNTIYYADATNPVTGGLSSTRASGTVTVNATGTAPSITVTPPTQTITAGQTATFTASSTTPGATFNWYTTPTGGTSIFTGAVFTSPPINGNTIYYAEAKDPVSGVVSTTRATGSITVSGGGGATGPDVAVTPPTQAINSGQTATFTASSTTAGATFNWYTTPTGGTSIFTGATFTSPALTAGKTYYAEAKDPVSGSVSPTRATGVVTINPPSNAPSITVTPPTRTVNAGQTTTFTASSTTAGATFNWYTTPTGGTSIFTGATFTTPPVNGNITYYAEAKDPVSGIISTTRATGAVTVNGGTGGIGPDVAVNPPTQAVNSGQTATFVATSTTPGATFNWYTVPSGGTAVFTGASFTTPPITAATTYYAEAKDPVSGNVSGTRATGKVTLNATGVAPSITVTPPTQQMNAGATASLAATSTTAGATFNWYTTPTGGTPIFTGAVFTTPPINGNVTYYADAKDPITGVVSTTRASGAITVNGGGSGLGPDVAVTPPAQAVNAGQTATFTASSTYPSAIFKWYTTPSGGTSIYTGAVFTTPAISSQTTYYAEAVDPVTSAVSASRATGTVLVNPGNNAPNVAVTPPTRAVNAGQTASFTASSNVPNAIFNWYTTPTGGTPVFTGPAFTTPPINGSITYYAEAKDPLSGVTSVTRATGTVTVNPAPSITITPPTQGVNTGQTATFTGTSTTPGSTINWYTTPTGGTPVFTGPTFTTPPITGDVTYYADATNPVTGAVSTTRSTGTVTVNPAPDITVTPPTRTINYGQTTSFTASSTVPNAVFEWYTTPTGGTPVFTGPTFSTPAIITGVTYYAQATNPVTGAVSTTRVPAAITLNAAPDVTVTPPTITINPGVTTTLTASSTTSGATFKWYTAATGGVAIFTGPTFITPPLTVATTYYAEATNPTTGAVSLQRAMAVVSLNNSANGIFVPNAFTPNGDGKNDLLTVFGTNIKSLKIYIYDQWGELQFSSTNKDSGWDGTYKGRAQPMGVYVYYLEANMNDGQQLTKKGTITLLR